MALNTGTRLPEQSENNQVRVFDQVLSVYAGSAPFLIPRLPKTNTFRSFLVKIPYIRDPQNLIYWASRDRSWRKETHFEGRR